MHLLLITQGQCQSEVTAGESSKNQASASLSALGAQQCKLLGQHLGKQLKGSQSRIRLMCSSAPGALETMRPLACVLRLRPAVIAELHECGGFQGAAGPSRDEICRRFPEFDASLIPETGQGSETPAQASVRAATLARLLKHRASAEGTNNEGLLVVVSHRDFVALLAKSLLIPTEGAPWAETYKDLFPDMFWPMNDTGVSHIILGVRESDRYAADAWLAYWNRSDHLAEDERTGVDYRKMGFGRAAEWARLGEGGSGLLAKFTEQRVVRRLGRSRAEILIAAVLGIILGALLRTRRT